MKTYKITSYKIPDFPKQTDRIDASLKVLGLEGILTFYKKISEEMVKTQGQATFLDFLDRLLKEERDWKEEERIKRWRAQAKFPYIRSLEDFDFSFQPLSTSSLYMSYLPVVL